jgi:hypothetical protein
MLCFPIVPAAGSYIGSPAMDGSATYKSALRYPLNCYRFESTRYLILTSITPTIQKLKRSILRNLLFLVLNSDFRVLNSDFRVLNSDFLVLNSDFRVLNSDFRVLNSDFRVLNSDFLVLNSGFRVFNSNFRVPNSNVLFIHFSYRYTHRLDSLFSPWKNKANYSLEETNYSL